MRMLSVPEGTWSGASGVPAPHLMRGERGLPVCQKRSGARLQAARGARYLDMDPGRGGQYVRTTRWNSRAPARQGPSEKRHPVYPQRFNWFLNPHPETLRDYRSKPTIITDNYFTTLVNHILTHVMSNENKFPLKNKLNV